MAPAIFFYNLLTLTAVAAAIQQLPQQQPLDLRKKPNIVFILTDDQDLELDSVDYMPLLQKHVVKQGTSYRRHYCSTAICCPSRVTLWTGKNAHNTNVTDVFPPYGGYPKFIAQGLNENYLPVWLQEGGYSTFYTGKLFNAHTVDNYHSPYPAGWTSSDFLLDPYTYQYLNATTQRNTDAPISWEGHYATDVLAKKAYGLLDEAVEIGKPFFLTVATAAPHSNVGTFEPDADVHNIAGLMSTPIPAERHKNLFANVVVPRTKNFNPGHPSGASWIKDLPQLNETVIKYNDEFYRARLQALQAVDELVDGVIKKLEEHGVLDETYVIYSTDNGYHISQHRLHPGKECGFEEDIHIPLFIRGPGIAANTHTDLVTAHTDLSPTILRLAGLPLRPDFDGAPIPLTSHEQVVAEAEGERGEHVNVEFWGQGIPEGRFGFSVDEGKIIGFGRNNTYKALRIVSADHNLYYSVWCTNEHELYDLATDPGQLHNLLPVHKEDGYLAKLVQRLDALLLVTKSCAGETCRNPWRVLHPKGNVASLRDALSYEFDSWYASVAATVKVSFDECALGYIREVEGPQSLGFGYGDGVYEL